MSSLVVATAFWNLPWPSVSTATPTQPLPGLLGLQAWSGTGEAVAPFLQGPTGDPQCSTQTPPASGEPGRSEGQGSWPLLQRPTVWGAALPRKGLYLWFWGAVLRQGLPFPSHRTCLAGMGRTEPWQRPPPAWPLQLVSCCPSRGWGCTSSMVGMQ